MEIVNVATSMHEYYICILVEYLEDPMDTVLDKPGNKKIKFRVLFSFAMDGNDIQNRNRRHSN